MGLLVNGVVLFAGAILMAVEILGSRVLAPSFGSSVYVWGSLISVFLTGMTVGAYLGGRLADRSPSHRVLAALLGAPALWMLLLPWLAPPVVDGLAESEMNANGATLLAAMALFLFPSVGLAAVTPFAVKLNAQSLSKLGTTAGTLSALASLGSIAGTLGTVFVLIPQFGTRAMLHGFGGLLVLLAAVVWWAPGREREGVPASAQLTSWLALAVFLSLFPGTVWAERKVLAEKESPYHRIIVYDQGGVRMMAFDQSPQSGMNLQDPHRLQFVYTDYARLALVLQPTPKSACFIGLGGGSLPKKFHRDFPSLAVDAIEIDPEVVSLAKQFFHLEEDARLRVHTEDARVFLRKAKRKAYDFVYIDAFHAKSVPFHLATREFLELVKKRLSPRGVVAWNVVGRLDGSASRLTRALYKTAAAVFPSIYLFPVLLSESSFKSGATGNILLLASQQPMPLSKEEFVEQASRLEPKLGKFADSYVEQSLQTNDVPLFTDDHAPVDSQLDYREGSARAEAPK